jgi:hypothetical protein
MVIEVEVVAVDENRGSASSYVAEGRMSEIGARETATSDHIAIGEVSDATLHVVAHHGATGAAFLPSRAEHEVVNDQLAAIANRSLREISPFSPLKR